MKLGRSAICFLITASLLALGTSAFNVFLNLYLKELGLSESMIGEVLSQMSLGSVVSVIPVAWLCSRIRLRSLLILAPGGCFLGYLIMLLAGNHWKTLLAGAFIVGIFIGAIGVVVAPFMMRHTEPQERTRLFSLYTALGFTMTAVSSIGFGWLMEILASVFSSRIFAYHLVLAGGCLLVIISGVLNVLLPKENIISDRRPIKDFLLARSWGLLFKITAPHFVIGLGAGLTIPFLNLYFQQRFASSTGMIGTYFSLCQIFTAAGMLYGPKLSKFIGSIRAIVLVQFLSVPFMLILAFTTSIWWAVFAFFCRALFMNMGWPLANHLSMEIVEENEQAATNALRNLSWNISWMVSAILGGYQIEHYGFTSNIVTTAILYVIANLMYFFFFRAPRFLAVR